MSETIEITNKQWRDLIWEDYICIDGEDMNFKSVQDNHIYTGRHTETHEKILQRGSDNLYFSVRYEMSVKDSMGWDECNIGDTKLIQVFPHPITTIEFKTTEPSN